MRDEEHAAAPAALPTGTVTFLLTDVEGSSRWWEQDPKATAAKIRRLNDLLDDLVEKHDGTRPVEQGEGDSAVVAFALASDAVACALDLQFALARSDDNPLRVRIGLHTGEAQLRNSGNYFGPSVNRCARIRSLAHGGQTLLSRSTYEIVAEHLPPNVSMRDLGPHPLKDLSRSESIYQLSHPELDNEFPPLRSLTSPPHNLPAQLTSFVGRAAEMSELRSLIADARLVTLTGSGGCGKTRLALETAADLVHELPDGVWWVDLGPVSDPDLVPSTLAAVLSLKQIPLQSLTDTIVNSLRDKNLLIVFDNCEHLIDACALLAESVVRSCPEVRVVATSREPLGIQGEVAWRVPSLGFPDAAAGSDAVEDFPDFEAVTLFVERAGKARAGFSLTPENAPAVAKICRRLDGIPLAIELAAARTRLLSPEEIAAALDDRFRLLSGGSRTALPRQRTLEASVDWSYHLLVEREKIVLNRLSVFSGGFTLAAAEDVCSGDGIERGEVLDLVAGLVDKSLVQVEETGVAVRYRLLETIRYFCLQKLPGAEDGQAARDRHLAYFLEFAVDADDLLLAGDTLAGLELFDQEHDNVRAAMDWAVDSDRVEDALAFARPLFTFWFVRGHFAEAARRLRSTLAINGGSPAVRAEATALAANLTSQIGDLPAALTLGEEAVALGRKAGSSRALGVALYTLGWITSFSDPERARELADESVTILRQEGSSFDVARVLAIRAIVDVQAGQLKNARARLEEALGLFGSPTNAWVPVSLMWLGVTLTIQGELTEAESVLDRGIALTRELSDDVFLGLQISLLSFARTIGGRYEEARSELAAAEELARLTSNPHLGASIQMYGGILAYSEGDLDEATQCLRRAAEAWEFIRLSWGQAFALVYRARVERLRGDFDEAARYAYEGFTLARDCSNLSSMGFASIAQSLVLAERRDDRAAERAAREALGIFGEIESKLGVVEALDALALAVANQSSPAEAARLRGAAHGIRERFYIALPVSERPEYDRVETRLRDALGSDFDEEWARGAALSLEEALDYAARGRGPRKRPASGWASLTPAEREVVRLVGEGLTNPQIGAKLFISKRTVQAHLSNVFVKLGVSSRVELAVEAERRVQEADPAT